MSATLEKLQIGKLIHERYPVFFKFLTTGFAALGAAAFFTPFAQEAAPFGVTRELMLIASFLGLIFSGILLIDRFTALDGELGWKEDRKENERKNPKTIK